MSDGEGDGDVITCVTVNDTDVDVDASTDGDGEQVSEAGSVNGKGVVGEVVVVADEPFEDVGVCVGVREGDRDGVNVGRIGTVTAIHRAEVMKDAPDSAIVPSPK